MDRGKSFVCEHPKMGRISRKIFFDVLAGILISYETRIYCGETLNLILPNKLYFVTYLNKKIHLLVPVLR